MELHVGPPGFHKRIFIAEGMMISIFGGIFGLVLGGILAWLQQEFGFIKLGNSEGSYIIDAYPVTVQVVDFLAVLATGFFQDHTSFLFDTADPRWE